MSNTDLYTLYGDEYRASYFKGLKGLSAPAKEAFEKEYGEYLTGADEKTQDDNFRTLVLRSELKKHPNAEVASLWDRRYTELDTPEKRNKVWAQLALVDDLDNQSDDADAQTSTGDWLRWFSDISRAGRNGEILDYDATLVGRKTKLIGKEQDTARNQAREYLTNQAEKSYTNNRNLYWQAPETSRNILKNAVSEVSSKVSPNYYGRYGTTDSYPDGFFDSLTVQYNSWLDAGGERFANEKLSDFWQDYYAKKQTRLEKWGHVGAKFGNEIASTGIMAAGIVYGLLNAPGDDSTEGYWNGIIDNEWTRYGADLFTTGQWDKSLQEEYKAKGWDKHAILNTVEQEKSLLNANTPYELLAQYGFTAASMLLSAGASGLVSGATKGLFKAGVAAGLKTTSAGRATLRGILGAGRVAQMGVPLAVALPESTLEALTTRDESLRTGEEHIGQKISEQIDQDILNAITADPSIAESYIKSVKDYDQYRFAFGQLQKIGETGEMQKTYSDLDIQRMYSLLRENPEYRKQFESKYDGYADAMMQQLSDAESKTLWTTLGLNAVVLGGINSTLQMSQQALGVRRAMGKNSANRIANAVDLIETSPNKWKALAKNVTKSDIFIDRLKESIGEGTEEISQGLISAYAQGKADNKVDQYFEYRYGNKDALDAFSYDAWQSMLAGLEAGGEALVSNDTFKEGLYGALSTLLGGPSVNLNMKWGKKQEGESTYDAIARNSPIAWRGIAELAFTSAEQNAQNKENQQIADAINSYFSDEKNANLVFDLAANAEATRAFNTHVSLDQEKEARDSKVDILFNTVSMLSQMKGTGYYDVVMSTLNDRTKFDASNLNDETSNEAIAVEEYKLQTGSTESNENILEEIKKSAQTMLDVIDSAEKASRQITRVFGNDVSIDVKNALVNNRLHIDDTERRIKTIEDEFNEIDFSDKKGEVSHSSNHSPSVKRGFARYGSYKEALKKQAELKDNARKTRELIRQLKAGKKKLPTEVYDERLYRLNEVQRAQDEEIQDVESYLKEIEAVDETEVVLSTKEIADLDIASRYALMNYQSNDRHLSNSQQREVEKFSRKGTKVDPDFKKKVKDLYALQESLNKYTDEEIYYMERPTALLRKADEYRKKTAQILARKKYEHLEDSQSEANASYEAFKEALINARAEAVSKEDLAAINEVSKNSPHYTRYEEEEKSFERFADKVANNPAYLSLPAERRNDLDSVLSMMFNQGAVSFDNLQQIYQEVGNYSKILTTNENGAVIFDDWLSKARVSPSNTFNAVSTIDDLYKILHSVKKSEDEINSRPSAAPADTQTGQSATPVVTPTEEKEESITPRKNFNISTIIGSFRSMNEANPRALTTIDKAEQIINTLSDNVTREELDKVILDEKDEDVKSALMYIRNVLNSGFTTLEATKSTVTNNPDPQAGVIESFSTTDLANMKSKVGGEKMKATLSSIFDFSSNPNTYAHMRAAQQAKKAIKFYIPSELEAEAREHFGDSYVPGLQAPVVILMPTNDGSITIDGKKYQPIGFLPASTNTQKSGANNTAIIRKSLLNSDGTIKTDVISPVFTTSWAIPGKAPEHIDASQPNTNVRDLVDQESSLSMNDFIDAMAVEDPKIELGEAAEGKQRPRLVINIPNFKKSGSTTPISVYITPAKDVRDASGMNLFDYLIADKQKEALEFNWRIKEVSDIFKVILGNKDFEDANEQQLSEIETEMNNQLGRYIRFSGGMFKLYLDKVAQQDGTNKVALSLGISETDKQTVLDDITNITEEEKNQKVFDLLKNLLLNKEHTAPRELSSTGQFLIYQVDYSNIRGLNEDSTSGTPNVFAQTSKSFKEKAIKRSKIERDIRAGMFSVSKSSLGYRAEGITFSLPVERAQEYETESTAMVNTNSVEFQPADAVTSSVETAEGTIVEPTTGNAIRETEKPQTEEKSEINPSTSPSVEEKKEENATPKKRQRSRNYDGNYASIGSKDIRRSDRSIISASTLRDKLKHDGITAEKWDNMTPEEKQRLIDCC